MSRNHAAFDGAGGGLAAGAAAGLRVEFGGASRTGPGHLAAGRDNQDAFAARVPDDASLLRHRGAVFAIADGVSSSPVSRDASELAVGQFVGEYLACAATRSTRDCAAGVLQALNTWLHAQNAPSRAGLVEHDGLVTTFTAVVAKSRTAHVFHIGDSRASLLRGGDRGEGRGEGRDGDRGGTESGSGNGAALVPLTQDHLRRHNGRPLLSRALGLEAHAEIDHVVHELREGDVLLLSSDGLHGAWPDGRLGAVLREELARAPADLESVAGRLVAAAFARGAEDDASCLLVRILALPDESEAETRRRATDVVVPPALSPGATIDGFEVLEIMHQSARSHLYRVRAADGRELALKAPSRSFADDAPYLEGFARERWLLARVDHPGVLRGVAIPEASPFLYLLTEIVPGRSLRRWMEEHPNPELVTVRTVLGNLVDALRALSRAGITHRDLKPENVMIDAQGHCTIIDFGTALVDGLVELRPSRTDDAPVGDLAYIAPESLLEGVADMRSDLWSLATIAYEMLAGRPPHDTAGHRGRRPVNRGAWRYRPLRGTRPDLPYWIDAALRRALSPHAELRHPVWSEFLAELDRPSAAARRQEEGLPWAERDPLRFWKAMSALLLVALCAALAALAR